MPKMSGFMSRKNTASVPVVTQAPGCHKGTATGVIGGVARELAVGMTADDTAPAVIELDALFDVQFVRIARVIARVTRDPSRAEELAVEVFLKWSRTPSAHGPTAVGWLYKTATRVGLNELRRDTRRQRYERLFAFVPSGRPHSTTPEDLHAANETREQVRVVLATLSRRQATLLLLRGDGLTYAEIAAALELNPASIGTLLARAESAFEKEYVRRYGDA
jgi:RNA polymerase sigma-70 factor (ECF subfamily)